MQDVSGPLRVPSQHLSHPRGNHCFGPYHLRNFVCSGTLHQWSNLSCLAFFSPTTSVRFSKLSVCVFHSFSLLCSIPRHRSVTACCLCLASYKRQKWGILGVSVVTLLVNSVFCQDLCLFSTFPPSFWTK